MNAKQHAERMELLERLTSDADWFKAGYVMAIVEIEKGYTCPRPLDERADSAWREGYAAGWKFGRELVATLVKGVE